MLDLSPETETLLEQEAAREGVSVETLIRRTFVRGEKPAPSPPPSDNPARVQNLLTEWQKEYGLPVPPGGFKTVAELFAQWNAEDATLTDAEREAERKLWEDTNCGRDVPLLQIRRD